MKFVELLSWAVWDLVRPRKLIAMAIIALAGPVFAILIRIAAGSEFDGGTAYGIATPLAVYSFSMILLSVIFASGIISSEMVGKTIPYLLTRPIPRWKILIAKWLGASIMVSAATMVACLLTALLTYGPSGLTSPAVTRDLLIIPVGALSYCSLFTMLSVLSLKPWLFAISFGFLWESWIPFLPGDFKKLSVMSQLRALSPHTDAARTNSGALEVLSLFSPENITTASAWNTLAILNVLAIGIALAVFTSAEFVPKDETT